MTTLSIDIRKAEPGDATAIAEVHLESWMGASAGIIPYRALARMIARGPRLQEDLTHELADILHEQLASQGSAVYIEGLHMCMAARGVGAHEARLVTSGVRGVFLELATREEFIKLVVSPQTTLV